MGEEEEEKEEEFINSTAYDDCDGEGKSP